MTFDPQAPHTDYANLLQEALGMSNDNIERRIKALQNLSDLPDEIESTAGMNLEMSALQHALELKERKI